jgi:lipoyl synthase
MTEASAEKARIRHPEKAHRPDNPVQLKKPDWIRVKAPTSKVYHETREIMRAHKLNTVCERRPARISGSAGRRSTRP